MCGSSDVGAVSFTHCVANEQGTLEVKFKRDSHAALWGGRIEEVTGIFGGVAVTPGCSFLMLPLWNPGGLA